MKASKQIKQNEHPRQICKNMSICRKYVKHMRGTEVTISHPSLKLMQTDGDAHECASHITFTIKKGEQKVIVP